MDKYKLIVFDWDQTLWNSWDLHVAGVWHAADLLGLSRPTEREIAPHYSMPIINHIGAMFPDNTQDVYDAYQEFYRVHMMSLGHLYKGVLEAVRFLKDMGYMLAVMSDKRGRYGGQEAWESGIGELFDSIHFREEDGIYKPNPKRLQVILDEMAIAPHETLVVGDSHVDIACAHNAGASSAAALWASVNTKATMEQEPDYVWNSVDEMFEAFETGRLAQPPARPLGSY